MNHNNCVRLIAEAPKIRDINKRREYLKTQRFSDEEIDGVDSWSSR